MDPIHCTLETYQLHSCKAFEALSYAWGDPTPVEPIFVSGSHTLIAHNLSVALRHLRFSKSCRALWIDAVCINQTDIGERNHQVFMMNQLYSAAERVLVRLGEARDFSDIAMAQLKELAEREETRVNAKPALMSLIDDCLMDRDWWGRLWVVQEVVLAKSDPIMICGSSSLPWSIFMKGYIAAGLNMVGLPEHYGRNVERISQCNALKDPRELYQSQIVSNGGVRLNAILRNTKDFHATDPRDKIYGTLGLLGTSEREKLKPDYQKPVELVFLEASQYLLTHDGCQYVNFFTRFSLAINDRTLSRACPSWVPDFSAQKSLSPCNPTLVTLPHGHDYTIFSCKAAHVSFQDRKRVLALTGFLFDTIEVVVELKDDQKLLFRANPHLRGGRAEPQPT